MKGFPKTIQTREDVLNCLELVRSKQLDIEEFETMLTIIDNLSYDCIPIIGVAEDLMSVTLNYCAEISSDSVVLYNGDNIDISTIEHRKSIEKSSDQMEENGFTTTIVTLVDKLNYINSLYPNVLKIKKSYDEYMRIGITKEEISNILMEVSTLS